MGQRQSLMKIGYSVKFLVTAAPTQNTSQLFAHIVLGKNELKENGLGFITNYVTLG